MDIKVGSYYADGSAFSRYILVLEIKDNVVKYKSTLQEISNYSLSHISYISKSNLETFFREISKAKGILLLGTLEEYFSKKEEV